MPLKLVDIDDRLIHGQVATTWIPDYGIESVIIVNDQCANDPVQRSVAGLAVPNIKVSVFTVEKFIHDDSELPADLVMEQGNIDDDIPERFFLLKVQLLDFEPQIWRRILISNKQRFLDLHYEIQREFGWKDNGLAGFFTGKGFRGEICRTEDFLDSPTPNPKLYRYLREGLSFGYIFDFNDKWQHWITVEKVVSDKSELSKKLIWAKGDNVLPY